MKFIKNVKIELLNFGNMKKIQADIIY